MKRRAVFVAKILVSAGLIAYLASSLDVHKIAATIASLRWSTFAAALGLAMVAYVGRAWRWRVILSHADVPIAPGSAYKLTLLGVFYGLVTPGRVGEFAKVLHLRRPAALTVPSILWERLFDLLVLQALCIPGILVLRLWGVTALLLLASTMAATVGLGLVLNHPGATRRIGSWLPRLASRLEPWRTGATDFLGTPAALVALGWTLFFYVFNFAGAELIARDLNADAGGNILMLFPLIILLGNLPITISGLGLRELVAAKALARAGMVPELGPALSLAWFSATTLVPGLVGALLGALGRRSLVRGPD